MEFTELSLAPAFSETEISLPMKRKAEFVIQNSVDLQLKEPLPLDWEQCLDLESGRMYYLNRKTLRRTWNWPEDHHQKLDLELNISSYNDQQRNGSEYLKEDLKKHKSSSSKTSMIALACSNCHLLVILSQSSPSCPNCKYVHSLPTQKFTPSSNNNPTPANLFNNLSL